MRRKYKRRLDGNHLGVEFGITVVVVKTTIKMAREPVKKQKENPARCSGEGKLSKGNIG